MKIINITRQKLLAQDIETANTLLTRMKGLLGKPFLNPGQALIITPCNSIHTFFMRFAIDVLFINRNNVIVGLIGDLKPFRLSPVYFNSFFAVELPAGTIQATSTQLQDTISIS